MYKTDKSSINLETTTMILSFSFEAWSSQHQPQNAEMLTVEGYSAMQLMSNASSSQCILVLPSAVETVAATSMRTFHQLPEIYDILHIHSWGICIAYGNLNKQYQQKSNIILFSRQAI